MGPPADALPNDPYPDITDAELADRVEALGKSAAEHIATARAYAEYAGQALDAANGLRRPIGTPAENDRLLHTLASCQ